MLVKLQVIDHYFLLADSWCFLFPGLGLCGSTCLTFKLSFVFCYTLKLLARFPTKGIISFTGCFLPGYSYGFLWQLGKTWGLIPIFWMGSWGHNSAMCWHNFSGKDLTAHHVAKQKFQESSPSKLVINSQMKRRVTKIRVLFWGGCFRNASSQLVWLCVGQQLSNEKKPGCLGFYKGMKSYPVIIRDYFKPP